MSQGISNNANFFVARRKRFALSVGDVRGFSYFLFLFTRLLLAVEQFLQIAVSVQRKLLFFVIVLFEV